MNNNVLLHKTANINGRVGLLLTTQFINSLHGKSGDVSCLYFSRAVSWITLYDYINSFGL